MSPYLRDLLERVTASFFGGMVAAMGATGDPDLTDRRVWIGGALAGAFAVAKGLAARLRRDRESASLVQ